MRVLKPPNTVGIPCQYRCNPISGSRNHPTPLESHVSTVGHISVPLESHIRVQKSRNTVGIPYNYRLNPISESRNHPKALESHIKVPTPPNTVVVPYRYRCNPIYQSPEGVYEKRLLPLVLRLSLPLQPTDTIGRQLSLQYTGNPLSTAGDVNGDGYSDILVGSPAAGTLSQGFTYLVFGGDDLPASFDLKSHLNGTNGVVFKGAITGETMML